MGHPCCRYLHSASAAYAYAPPLGFILSGLPILTNPKEVVRPYYFNDFTPAGINSGEGDFQFRGLVRRGLFSVFRSAYYQRNWRNARNPEVLNLLPEKSRSPEKFLYLQLPMRASTPTPKRPQATEAPVVKSDA